MKKVVFKGDTAMEYTEDGLVGVRRLKPPSPPPSPPSPPPSPPSPPASPPSPPADLMSLKHMDIVAFNQESERAFVAMLAAMCEKMPEGVPTVGLRAEAAFRLNISTETVKRYIEKWCYAFSAPFTVRDGFVFRKVQDDQEN